MAKNRWLPSTCSVYIPRYVSLQVGGAKSVMGATIDN